MILEKSQNYIIIKRETHPSVILVPYIFAFISKFNHIGHHKFITNSPHTLHIHIHTHTHSHTHILTLVL